MLWRDSGQVRWLEADLPGARAAFSTRTSGSAKAGIEPLARALGLDRERIASARQVHGAELIFHRGDSDGLPASRDAPLPAADGHVIAEPGTCGLIFVADCLPVAVAGPRGAAILHCGWRGLAAGIVARGVAAVGATHAAIGPGIGPCCYEVGDEVLTAFADLGDAIASGRMLDLAAVATELLRRSGVETIDTAGLCSRCEAGLFFSHRREAEAAGRQAGLVWLRPEEG